MTATPLVMTSSFEPEGPSLGRRIVAFGRSSFGLVLASGYVILVALWAVVPGAFSPSNPLKGDIADRLLPPSSVHLFGTDDLGRDLFTRVVHGTAQSIEAVLIAIGIAFFVGLLVGAIAAFAGGIVDEILMRIVDTMLAIPSLLIAMMIITVTGYGLVNIAIAVGVSSIAGFARIMRSEALRIRTEPFVEAAHASGVRWGGVLLRHVIPNSVGPAVAFAAIEIGNAILSVSALSFLGYGAPPPTPEWGRLVADGRDFIATSWWLVTFPGIVIALLVLSMNRISQDLEERWR